MRIVNSYLSSGFLSFGKIIDMFFKTKIQHISINILGEKTMKHKLSFSVCGYSIY